LHLPDVILHVLFHAEFADDNTGNYGNKESGSDIDKGDFPAKQTPEKHQGNFVHHWGGYEKGKGDTERHTRFNESNEERDSGTGAERGYYTQQSCHNVPNIFTFMRKYLAGFLGGELGAYDGNNIDDNGKQEEDLNRIVDKKIECFSESASGFESKKVKNDIVSKILEHAGLQSNDNSEMN
jgi:hypothetical protein